MSDKPDTVTISKAEYEGLKRLECACNRAISIRNAPTLPIISEALDALDRTRNQPPIPEEFQKEFGEKFAELEQENKDG